MKITRTINGETVDITLTDEEVREIVEEVRVENLKEDIKWWFEENEKEDEETDELIDDMVDYITHNENPDGSLWDNIASAFYFCT